MGLSANTRQLVAVVRVLYQNRKAEVALVVSLAAIAREIVQAASGH